MYLLLSLVYCLISSVVAGSKSGSLILSDTSFESLSEHVNDLTLKGIKDMGFKTMTHIQAKAIPPLLEGRIFSRRCLLS